MSHDFDGIADRSPPIVTTYVPHPTDLEAIVTLLEIAALSLTPTPGATFTFAEVLAEANRVGGGEVVLDACDARIVVDAGLFRKTGGRLSLK